MAAAEYFNPSAGAQYHPPPPSGLASQNGPHNAPQNLGVNPPYPMSDAPPPYSAFAEQRPHSQPPPQHRPQPPDDIYRPAPPPTNGYLHDNKDPRSSQGGLHNMYRPSDFSSGQYKPSQQPQSYQLPYQQSQPGYPFPNGAPAMSQGYSDGGRNPSSTPGYALAASPYRERSRSRSRSRSRHRKHHRPQTTRKKSSGVNTFLGAGGGALIGDAIFPGLGTLGGALFGGAMGHEYSKKRTQSNPSRTPRHRSYSNDFDYYEGDKRRGRKY
ncbi:hypothetical protein AC578_2080 [Pseudocercospora eumusae]|uniref:Uncharacterized protein n=1 Tax=Pseudocercospora eumusae TaxID=321146 RepID=A0A139HQE6_9PEZI|nr:hypothetical protein AC578_2080 [Pseudocercospora eumusae]